MIALAMFTLNFFHPAFLLGRADRWRAVATVNAAVSKAPPSEADTVSQPEPEGGAFPKAGEAQV